MQSFLEALCLKISDEDVLLQVLFVLFLPLVVLIRKFPPALFRQNSIFTTNTGDSLVIHGYVESFFDFLCLRLVSTTVKNLLREVFQGAL